jgi:hypothetical protein
MPVPSAHYVKFARSLALTSTLVLTACIASPETGEPGDEVSTPPAKPAPSASGERTEAMPVAEVVDPARLLATPTPQHAAPAADPGAAPDAGPGPSPGHVSGPLPPPELPASFA